MFCVRCNGRHETASVLQGQTEDQPLDESYLQGVTQHLVGMQSRKSSWKSNNGTECHSLLEQKLGGRGGSSISDGAEGGVQHNAKSINLEVRNPGK